MANRKPNASQTLPRILVVDDDPGTLELMDAMLSTISCEVTLASHAALAQEKIAHHPRHFFQAALVDYRMPGIDGLELLKWMYRNDPTLAVIIMTAESDVELVTQALRFGACDFVVKPFRMKDIGGAVNKAVKMTRERRYLETAASEVQDITAIHDRLSTSSDLHAGSHFGDHFLPQVESRFFPIQETGGDFVNCFPINEEQIFIVIGDVSGHDLKAGFISAYFQGIVRGMVNMRASLKEICEYCNRFLIHDWNQRGHVDEGVLTSLAACFLLVDFGKRRIFVLNNGFPLPWMATREARFERLGVGSSPLGWFELEGVGPTEHGLPSSGCCMLWSDGLVDYARELELCPFALAHYLLHEEDHHHRARFLQGRKDDILVLRLSWQQRRPSEAFAEPRFVPVFLGHYAGNKAEAIDVVQERWKRCLNLFLPGLKAPRLQEILLCAREGLLNALHHGCRGCSEKCCILSMVYSIDSQTLKIRIEDEGTGYNTAQEPPGIANAAHTSLGIRIMRAYADEFFPSEGGKILTLHFNLSR
jgi:FixJ family two-component response regulator/anti-sigma regulatory factor (Ser/Thr protein kinase)